MIGGVGKLSLELVSFLNQKRRWAPITSIDARSIALDSLYKRFPKEVRFPETERGIMDSTIS
jgi:hypothetical protein